MGEAGGVEPLPLCRVLAWVIWLTGVPEHFTPALPPLSVFIYFGGGSGEAELILWAVSQLRLKLPV